MSHPAAFDAFADIYDAWVASAPITRRNAPFYVDEYLCARGPVAELGVGTGRIAIAAALRGCAVTGVDGSPLMLERCRAAAHEAGVDGLLTLVEADLRTFTLPEPAGLIAIPFHTVGVLLDDEERRACLRRIHEQLAPGGRLVFDHFVFDPELARREDRRVSLRAETRDERGRAVLLFVTTVYDFDARRFRVVCWTDTLDADGRAERRYRFLDLSWIEPEHMRALLEETGFEVEHLWGDFDRRPFDPASSPEQVWVARRLRAAR